MVGKNVTAQELTIKLLIGLNAAERMLVYRTARKRLAEDVQAADQLDLCVMMGGELTEDPQKYHNNFPALAKTILARQRNCAEKEITKKEIWGVLRGTDKNGKPLAASSGNNTLDRIQDHARELRPEEIIRLCAGFSQKSNRLFWENQVYLAFPNLRTADVTDGPVLNCLQAVWESLPEERRETAPFVFLPYADWFEKLSTKTQEQKTKETLNGLYEILESARQCAGVAKTEMYNILEIDPDTYAAYKKAWYLFEKSGCTGDFPRNRLSRDQLLCLAIYLKMDFHTAVMVLATAGYSFRLTTSDSIVVGYLLDRRYSREKALQQLRLR